MNQDEQHLRLLSIFHYILGPLTILLGSIFLIHVGIGIATLAGTFPDHGGPPDVFGWFFVAFGSIAVLAGWTIGVLMIIAGKRLAEHRSRTFCIVVAAIECMIQPFGTILGVFTIVVLMKDSVAGMFAANDFTEKEGTISPPV